MNRVLKNILFHVFLPLVAGLIIYVILRPDNWIVHKLFPRNTTAGLLVTPSSPVLLKWFAGSGADFCWSYAFASALFIWKKTTGNLFKHFFVLVLLLVLSFELIQLLLPSQFTFDIVDLVAAFFAVLLSWLLNRSDA